ncbi:MAG TPA: hypothetical protein VFQ70_03325 [Candidatus Saccharimonadaceae bacterium]|nr:hypothetical protein [Candidatus Saccharimonadaceae bacterium]
MFLAPKSFAASLNPQHGLLTMTDLDGTTSGGVYGLQNGFATAIQNDVTDSDSCKNATDIAREDGASMNTLRQKYMNQSFMYKGVQYPPASYVPLPWLSGIGTPNTNNPVYVDYGQKSIKLQFNLVLMLCGDLVRPDYTGSSCNSKVSVMYNDDRWVRAGRADYPPNPLGSECLEPAMSEQNTKVTNLDVTTTTGALKGSVSLVTPQYMTITRDNDSRYWYAMPITFTYTFDSPNGITGPGTLLMTAYSQQIDEYTGVYRCSINGGQSKTVQNDTDFGGCFQYQTPLSLSLRLRSNDNLVPTIQVGASSVTAGASYPVSGSVDNTGTTASSGTKWQITRMVYAPGVKPPSFAGGNKATNPCATLSGYEAGSCQSYQAGTQNFAIGQSGALGSSTDTANEPVGSSICYLMSVNTPTPASNPAWGHSGLSCVVIGKKPVIQIWGGDLRTGGGVNTSQSVISSPAPACYYGSWVEYGALINLENDGARFGSGASLAGTPSQCEHALGGFKTNPMTFANANSGGVLSGTSGFGNFDDSSLMTQSPTYSMMANNQLGIPSSGTLSGPHINLNGLSGYYTLSKTVQVSGDSIPDGKTIVIDDPKRTVEITGNIAYANANKPYGSISDIPQVIIIAHRISIDASVSTINAWLLSDGVIDTCGNQTPSLTKCDQELTVNGPFAAQDADFKRTAGSDSGNPSNAGNPAEVLNLRADAYLWEYAQAAKNVTPSVVQITQLPPRY